MFWLSLIIAAAAAAADQLIKIAVDRSFELYEIRRFIPHVMSLTHIRNSGAAWSIMEGKTWFLVLLPLVMIAAAVVFIYRSRHGSKLACISLALVVGGGVGNLIDRIRLHEVIDYLKLELFDFPIFNFADICVVVGAVLFCVYLFFFDEDGKAAKSVKTDGATAEDTAEGSDDRNV